MYFITTKRMLEVCFFQHTPTFIIEPEKDAEIQRVLDFRIFFCILGKISVSNICMLSQCMETS